MIYTTFDLQKRQKQILDEALTKPVFIRRRGERFRLVYEPADLKPNLYTKTHVSDIDDF